MYIAHICTHCHKDDILYPSLTCSCGFTETQDMFWSNIRSASYLRDIESEIEQHYPYRDLSIIHSMINLSIGYHITGRFKQRDACIINLNNSILDLYQKWHICYCQYTVIEDIIHSYEKIPRTGKPKESMYISHINTSREFFKPLIIQWKNLVTHDN